MAGALVPGGDKAESYQVCWNCDIALQRGSGNEWQGLPLKLAKKKSPELLSWTKFSDTHWQVKIDGDILDYWPTTRRYRFKGVTAFGRPEDVIGIKIHGTPPDPDEVTF